MYLFECLLIAKNTWKKLAEDAATNKVCAALVTQTRALAKQLGVNITKRKASQAIPVIGAAVGFAMNITFIRDICEAAQMKYKERWINNKLHSVILESSQQS